MSANVRQRQRREQRDDDEHDEHLREREATPESAPTRARRRAEARTPTETVRAQSHGYQLVMLSLLYCWGSGLLSAFPSGPLDQMITDRWMFRYG